MMIKMRLSRQVVYLWSVIIMIYIVSIIQTVQIDVTRPGTEVNDKEMRVPAAIPPEQQKRGWMNVWAGRTGVCSVAAKSTTQPSQRHTRETDNIQTGWKGFSLFPPKLGFNSIKNQEEVPPPAKSAPIPEGEKDKSEY